MSEIRFDRVKLGKIKKTSEGFLHGIAPATRTGVFTYQNMDGTERHELRHPDDILTEESLESLKFLPITNDHPDVLVNHENASVLSVGMTGETIEVKDGYINVSLKITHKDAIKAVQAGKQELSCGYTVNVIKEDGEYNGEKYTHRQINPVYNHLALVTQGRAGRDVRLNFDGAFTQCEKITENDKKEFMKTNETSIEELAKTIANNPSEIDINKVTPTVINPVVTPVIGESEQQIATKEFSPIKQENTDSLLSTIEQLKAENEAFRKINIDSLIIEKAKQRAIILKKASLVINTDALEEKSEREIMEEAIKSRVDAGTDLSKKSNDYIEGRFDSIIEDSSRITFRKQMSNIDTSDQPKAHTSFFDIMKAQQNAQA